MFPNEPKRQPDEIKPQEDASHWTPQPRESNPERTGREGRSKPDYPGKSIPRAPMSANRRKKVGKKFGRRTGSKK